MYTGKTAKHCHGSAKKMALGKILFISHLDFLTICILPNTAKV